MVTTGTLANQYTVIFADGAMDLITVDGKGLYGYVAKRLSGGEPWPEFEYLGRQDDTRRVWAIKTGAGEPKAIILDDGAVRKTATGWESVTNAR